MNKEHFEAQLKQYYTTDNDGQYNYYFCSGYHVDIDIVGDRVTIDLKTDSVTVIPSKLMFMGKIESYPGNTIEPYSLALSLLKPSHDEGMALLQESAHIHAEMQGIENFRDIIALHEKHVSPNSRYRGIMKIIQLPDMLSKWKEDFVSPATLTIEYQPFYKALTFTYSCGMNFLENRVNLDELPALVNVGYAIERLAQHGTIVGYNGRNSNGKLYSEQVKEVLSLAGRKYFIDEILKELD